MKRRGLIAGVYLLLIFLAWGCDEGKIYPDEVEDVSGGKGTMQVSFKGLDAWPQQYMLIFAAFGEDGDMPVISKIISRPDTESQEVTVTLNGLDERTQSLSVAVANKGRQPLYRLYSYPVDDPSKEIVLPVSEIDLAGYDRIQKQVFDSYCIRCHGAGSSAAAGLNLTSQYSHAALVGVEARLSGKGLMLVEPGNARKSFLREVLEEDIINYNHTDVLPEAELIQLIETWINDGAKGIGH